MQTQKYNFFLFNVKRNAQNVFDVYFGQFEVFKAKNGILTKRSLPVKTIASAYDVSSA